MKDYQNLHIAVLPFINLSPRVENEFFSDGMTEEIIGALSKIENLRVTSRTSSFYFKNKNIPVKQIAAELNVKVILEGSIRLSGDVIRITAQLIQANDDFHFWSETWERKLESIFEIQDEISLIIADKIREQFVHLEIQDHLIEKQTPSIDAYEYYLKALSFFRKWNAEDVKIAISLYQKALELDSHHTQSMVGLADCYSFMATMGFMPIEEGWGKAHELTNQAIALNDKLPSAHYQLSNLTLFTASDYRQSFNHCARALELNPNYVEARQHMSLLCLLSANPEEAREHLQIALELDPLSQETHFFTAFYHYVIDDHATALLKLDQCLQHNPKNLPAHCLKCLVLLKMGRYEEVITYFETHPKAEAPLEDQVGLASIAIALKGDKTGTEKYFNKLQGLVEGSNGFTANAYIFLFFGATGQRDSAFDWIKQNQGQSPLLLFHFADPMVEPLRQDPRYKELHNSFYFHDQTTDSIGKRKELLDAQSVTIYSTRLMDFIQKSRPYLNPELSLRALAEQINIHPNQLSWLLNNNFKVSFNEYINRCRLEAFKELCNDPRKSNLTLIGLAYECGFNSKTVFNTYFKKEMGMTPKEFQNSLKRKT